MSRSLAFDAWRRSFFLAMCAMAPAAVATSVLQAEPCLFWEEQAPEMSPSPRYGHAMASDADRGRIVLVGGMTNTTPPYVRSDETWEWDGHQWHLMASAPSACSSHTIAYDSARRRTVLFGGMLSTPSGSTYNTMTWEWDAAGWQQLVDAPHACPHPRTHHAMVYDQARAVTVLFGGFYFDSGILCLWSPCSVSLVFDDTWEWDGVQWTERIANGPSARAGHAMTYDNVRQVTVLFGGYDGSTFTNDTWEWDGETWTLRTPATSPSARANAAMTFDPTRGVCVLFGGRESSNASTPFLDDTWEWDGSNWARQTIPPSPPARCFHTMAHDSVRGMNLLLSGYGGGGIPLNDTWLGGLNDADGDGLTDPCDDCTDTDGDGFGNPGYPAGTCPLDNCPGLPNADQADTDADDVGDVCDNCPSTANTDQADADGDRIGDACDPCTDTDGDGFGDPGFAVSTCGPDNCPHVSNPEQADADSDGIGDACDACPDSLAGAMVDATGCPIPIPGDFDHDGDVDQADFGHLQVCMSGNATPQTDLACQAARLDGDSDVDDYDVAIFVRCMSGPRLAGDPHCAD